MTQAISIKPQYISNKRHLYRSITLIRSGLHEPTECLSTWLDSTNTGYVGISNLASPSSFYVQAKYSDIIDISACLDGNWVRYGNKYLFITHDEPVVATCDNSGIHITSKLSTLDIPVIASSVSIIRGWKSLISTEDMGIVIAAYIPDTGSIQVFTTDYFSYSLIDEIQINNGVRCITLHTTSDYRLLMYVDYGSTTEVYASERLYIGGAVAPESCYIGIDTQIYADNTCSEILKTYASHTDDKASISIGTSTILSNAICSTVRPFNITAYNDGGTKIYVDLNTDVILNDFLGITAEAGNGYSIIINNVSYTKRNLVIDIEDISRFMWPITIKYNGQGLSQTNGNIVNEFSTTFMPQGIENILEEPPAVLSITNI